MNCPACGNELVPLRAGSLAVDVCHTGCAGLWFDLFELGKLEKEPESATRALLHFNEPTDQKVDSRPKRACPRCRDQVMMRRFFSRKREVEIDECPSCGGIWLDGGELEAIKRESEELSSSRGSLDVSVRLVYRYFNPTA